MLPADFAIEKHEFAGGVEFVFHTELGLPDCQIFSYKVPGQLKAFWGCTKDSLHFPLESLLKREQFPILLTYQSPSFSFFRLDGQNELHEFILFRDELLSMIRASYGNTSSLEDVGLDSFRYKDMVFFSPDFAGRDFEQEFLSSYSNMTPTEVSEAIERPVVFADVKKKDLIFVDPSCILPIDINFLERIIRRTK